MLARFAWPLLDRASAAGGGGGGGGPVPTILYDVTNWRWGATAGGTQNLNLAGGTYIAGDVFLLLVETANEAMATPTLDSAATFTEVINVPNASGTRLTVFVSDAIAGTETTLTYADSGDHQIFWMLRIRGCEFPGGSAVHKVGTGATGASTSVTLGGFTTTINNCLVLGLVAQHDVGTGGPDAGTWANSSLTSVVGESGFTNGAGNNGGLGVGHGTMATAGAVGNFTVTAGTSTWAGVQIAIR